MMKTAKKKKKSLKQQVRGVQRQIDRAADFMGGFNNSVSDGLARLNE